MTTNLTQFTVDLAGYLLRLITPLTPALALKYYGYRYRIESMFKHLKPNGFHLQDLNMCRLVIKSDS